MKRTWSMAGAALLCAGTLLAQDSSGMQGMRGMRGMQGMQGMHMQMMMQQPQPPAFAWYFNIGFYGAQWGDVATAFNAAGYNDPGSNLVSVGFGGYRAHRRFLLGGEAQAQISQAISSVGGRDVRVTNTDAFLTVGYAVVQKVKVRAYPFIGIGGVMSSFRIDNVGGTGLGPSTNSPSFGQVLATPGRRSVIGVSGLGFEAGGGFDFVLFQKHTRKGMYGPLVGVRAGYQFVPVRGDWKLFNEVALPQGPDHIGNGFFVRVSIGGAGRKHSQMAGGCPMMQGGSCPMMQGNAH